MLRTRLPLTSPRIATVRNPLDLHALDTPPTFVLSQDQTLRKIVLGLNKTISYPHTPGRDVGSIFWIPLSFKTMGDDYISNDVTY